MENEVIVGYSLDHYRKGEGKIAFSIPYNRILQGVISGGTGSGKSTCALWFIASMIRSVPTELWLLDFKRDEMWQFLDGYPRYYTNEACFNALCKFYDEYVEIRNSGKPYPIVKYLLFDEYPSFISNLMMMDKLNKTHRANEAMSKIAEIMGMGRSLNVGTLVLCQRNDSTWFNQGSRENLMMRVLLGNNSTDSMRMMFNGLDLPEKHEVFKAGEGFLAIDGYPLMTVKYPMIRDMPDFKHHVFHLLMNEHMRDCTLSDDIDFTE